MNNWNNWNYNGNCGCHKEEEKDYYFKCEKVEKERPCNYQQNPYFRPYKNCCCN